MAGQSSRHGADAGRTNEGERGSVETFVVLGEAPTAAGPDDGALGDRASGNDREPFGLGRARDDLDLPGAIPTPGS